MQRYTKVYKGIHRYTKVYIGIPGYTRVNRGIQRVYKGYTRGYMG